VVKALTTTKAALGAASAPERPVLGGRARRFERGDVYWSPATPLAAASVRRRARSGRFVTNANREHGLMAHESQMEAEVQMLRNLLARMHDLHNYPDREDLFEDMWGERCAEFQEGCGTCEAYKLRDDVTAALASWRVPARENVAPVE
jgi:hypothetical protein